MDSFFTILFRGDALFLPVRPGRGRHGRYPADEPRGKPAEVDPIGGRRMRTATTITEGSHV